MTLQKDRSLIHGSVISPNLRAVSQKFSMSKSYFAEEFTYTQPDGYFISKYGQISQCADIVTLQCTNARRARHARHWILAHF